LKCNCGAIFKVTKGARESVLYRFAGGSDRLFLRLLFETRQGMYREWLVVVAGAATARCSSLICRTLT
jgi:hypothetical protein